MSFIGGLFGVFATLLAYEVVMQKWSDRQLEKRIQKETRGMFK